MKHSIIAIVSLLLLVGTVARGYADEKLPSPQDAVARAHLDAGNKAYRLKDFDAAIREYRAGAQAETGPTYTFWYNLGQSYRQLGRYEDATVRYSSSGLRIRVSAVQLRPWALHDSANVHQGARSRRPIAAGR